MFIFVRKHFPLAVLFSLPAMAHAAGFGINTTRLVYPENTNSISVTLRNTESTAAYLVQSGVSRVSSHATAAPFTVVPPLVRLEPGSTNDVRILASGAAATLPADRESVFYLRTAAIPGSKKDASEDNRLRFAVGKTIKLFYRPKGLPGTALDAQKNLQFTRVSEGLKATNASPYHVSLAQVSLGNKNLSLDPAEAKMLAPFASYTWPMPAASGTVKWKAIDDHGGKNAYSQTLP